MRPSTHRDGERAFTLVEMIVCVIIVGALAAMATVGYAHFADGARDAKVQEQLRQFTQMALAYAAENDINADLTYPMYQSALTSFPDHVVSGTTAGGLGWAIVPGTQAPADQYQFSVAFDNGIGTPIVGQNGTRAAIVTRSDTGRFFATVNLAAPNDDNNFAPSAFEVPPGASAADVLGGAAAPEAPLPYTEPAAGSGSTGGSTSAGTVTNPSVPTSDPVTNPVSVTPRPETDWLSCTGYSAGSPRASVTDAQISSKGDSGVWWSVAGDTNHIVGYKICAKDNQSDTSYYMLASTGPGTGDARTWVVRTNVAHPNIFVAVVTVLDDGREFISTNSCEVRPAGNGNGWDNQGRGC